MTGVQLCKSFSCIRALNIGGSNLQEANLDVVEQGLPHPAKARLRLLLNFSAPTADR